MSVFSAALASEEDVQAAYQSYREAQSAGDLRGALEFAERAHAEAVSSWGEGTPETYRYIAALARTQNDLVEYRDALRVILPGLQSIPEVEGWPRYSFELYFEAGRAARGRKRHDDALGYFSVALSIAVASYGSDSLRAGYAHMELARSHLNKSGTRHGDELRNRLIGSGYPQVAGSVTSLQRAIDIFSQRPESVVEQQILETIRAGNLMAEGDMDEAGEVLEPAMANLTTYGYMDDYALGLYIDWIGTHLTHWTTRRMERLLLQAMEYGLLRQEGEPISLARTLSTRHRRICVERIENGYARLEFSIDENGQVPRTAITESNMPEWWQQAKRENIRTWIFVPAQRNGRPTRVDGVRMRTNAGSSDDC